MDKEKNILLAVPCFGGTLHFKTAEALRLLDRELSKLGISHTYRYVGGESLVTRARNWFANLALFGTDENGAPFSDLLFVDAELAFSPLNVVEMLQANRPIVALPYSKKGINWQSVAEAARRGVTPDQLPQYAGIPVFGFEGEFDLNKPTPAVAVGTGVMLIQVSVLRDWQILTRSGNIGLECLKSSFAALRATPSISSKSAVIRRLATTYPKIIGLPHKPKSWDSKLTCFRGHKQRTAGPFNTL